MVKKKKKTKRPTLNNDVFDNHLNQITKKEEPKNLKKYFINILIILGLITFFTGGWFPFGIYDRLTISQKEINYEWTSTYKPLIKWCYSYQSDSSRYLTPINSSVDKLRIDREPGLDLDKYSKIPEEVKKCIEDKDHRIYLFNNQPWKVKSNNSLKKAFSEIKPNLLKYSSADNDLINIKQAKIYTNMKSWRISYKQTFEEYLERYQYDEEKDLTQYICLKELISTFCDRDYELYQRKYLEEKKDKIFRVGFLTVKNFWMISKACNNGCIANIGYIKENDINYIQQYEIINFIPHKFDNFSDKKNEKVIKYEKMINEIKRKVKELTLKYNIPNWSINISI